MKIDPSKATLYEAGVRSPLVVWGPGFIPKKKAGTINKTSIFSAIDVKPCRFGPTSNPLPQPKFGCAAIETQIQTR